MSNPLCQDCGENVKLGKKKGVAPVRLCGAFGRTASLDFRVRG